MKPNRILIKIYLYTYTRTPANGNGGPLRTNGTNRMPKSYVFEGKNVLPTLDKIKLYASSCKLFLHGSLINDMAGKAAASGASRVHFV